METLKYNDQKGIELKVNDIVTVVDVNGLEDCDELKEGAVLTVTELLDLESNYIEFISNSVFYEFYGFRVIKINP
mgnify:CR=1 FL=1